MLLTTASQAVWAHELAPDEYDELRVLSVDILKRFPPDQYYYLGLGRSPTLVMAFLSEATQGTTANLPLSEVKKVPLQMDRLGIPLEKIKPKLFEHFSRFVPAPESLDGRKILLIDFVDSGDSLALTYEWLREYLARACANCGIEVLGLSETGKGYGYKLFRLPATFIELESKYPRLSQKVFNQEYDVFSEYPQFKPILDRSESFERRVEYDELRRGLKERMAKDRWIQAEFRKLPESARRRLIEFGPPTGPCDHALAGALGALKAAAR